MLAKKIAGSQREFHSYLSFSQFRYMTNRPEAMINPNLTRREIEIIEALSLGLSSDEISAKLFISALTVSTHRKNAMRKANARSAAHLVRICFEGGVISGRSQGARLN
ncbi:MAG: helix-turn-helix transcriptional regulator [Bacteroidota bacterium]